eukprot:CAMPEP_0168470160 /NCGR_PEP_ID=MMETSP0228-20121227/58590_1 /TAXON_ID=133427 /ORGANISM="Protoceratium reticulatum, Strain CCCM 535 (=CCMP 1889)" /LENGTH=39 /DNA_ID= /DNA_START= /DNA_END= /DNA_ORIENTATION=
MDVIFDSSPSSTYCRPEYLIGAAFVNLASGCWNSSEGTF